jgi:hypothetical protein
VTRRYIFRFRHKTSQHTKNNLIVRQVVLPFGPARILVGLIQIRMMMAAVVATIMIMMMIMMIPTIVTARDPPSSSVIQIIGRIVAFFVCHDGRHHGREGGGGRTRCGGGEGGRGGWVRPSLVVGRCSGRGRGGSTPEYGVIVFCRTQERPGRRPTDAAPTLPKSSHSRARSAIQQLTNGSDNNK